MSIIAVDDLVLETSETIEQELVDEILRRTKCITLAYSENPDLDPPQPPSAGILMSWCQEQGWTDLQQREGIFWAFPPGAVMPVPILPTAEKYCGFLLSPVIYEHGWKCDFIYPNGRHRRGGVSHQFQSHALAWGKRMVDTGAVNALASSSRQFADQPVKLRPQFSMLDSAFKDHFPDRDSPAWLLAAYLLLHLSDQGQVNFWEHFLAPTINFKPRTLTHCLKDLDALGIVRYRRWPNRNCPSSFYLGPAWLSVDGLNLNSEELEAIEDGEMFRTEKGYLWGLPAGERGGKNSRTLQHEGHALVRIPKIPGFSWWSSTWADGVWTHRRKADDNAEAVEVTRPPKLSREEFMALASVKQEPEYYQSYCLRAEPNTRKGSLVWACNVELPGGKRLKGYYDDPHLISKESALDRAKVLIDLGDPSWLPRSLDEQSDNPSVLLQHLNAILERYVPNATEVQAKLLKMLIVLFQRQGRVQAWEKFLAAGLGLTTRQLLNRCRELTQLGVLRYGRYQPNSLTWFSLGPAWLSAESTLNAEELAAIVRGELYCSYKSLQEKEQGEGLDLPCAAEINQSFWCDTFIRDSSEPARWKLVHEDDALVRALVQSNQTRWYSTWRDGQWSHREISITVQ